jgi:hypothetical protein
MKIITVYCTYSTDEQGSKYGSIRGTYKDKATAKLAAIGIGAWGAEGFVEPFSCLVINKNGINKYYLLHQKDPVDLDVDTEKAKQAAKIAALAKLTDEEISLLNIQ